MPYVHSEVLTFCSVKYVVDNVERISFGSKWRVWTALFAQVNYEQRSVQMYNSSDIQYNDADSSMIYSCLWSVWCAWQNNAREQIFVAVVCWLAEYEQRRLRKLVQQCCWCYSRVYMMCWDDLQQVINLVSGFSVCCLKCIDVWAEIETMTSSRDDVPRWWSAVMTSWR